VPVAVVTGASSGIGQAAAVELARRGWTVALVGRDEKRLAAAVDEAGAAGAGRAAGYRADFDVLDDVRRLAGELRAAYPRLDLLPNNAGGAFAQQRTTVDGFDQTLQVNHLAPFLLSHELRPVLAGGRIVNTASTMHQRGHLDPDELRGSTGTFRSLLVYADAKQANVLFTRAAARRWPEIVSTAYHPGVVRTRFGNESALMSFFYRANVLLRTPARGADTLVWLATADPGAIRSGAYYADRRERTPGGRAADDALADHLWTASAAAVGVTP
jgi:NAD(P)-dependent dehydrogenase (short-subunit alcohol dehydrogenase family)